MTVNPLKDGPTQAYCFDCSCRLLSCWSRSPMITWCGSLSTSSWSAPVSSTTSTRCTLPSSTTSASHSSTRWSWERPTATSGYASHLARCIIIFVLMQFSRRCRIRRTLSDCSPFTLPRTSRGSSFSRRMSADTVFCQTFFGLPTGAVRSTTNLTHAFTQSASPFPSSCPCHLILDHLITSPILRLHPRVKCRHNGTVS